MSDTPHQRETEWLFQRLNALEDQMREQHQRLRSDMNAGFERVAREIHEGFAGTDQRLKAHSGRLLVIETERGMEAKQAIKRGTWAGIAAAAGLTGLLKIIEHMVGMK